MDLPNAFPSQDQQTIEARPSPARVRTVPIYVPSKGLLDVSAAIPAFERDEKSSQCDTITFHVGKVFPTTHVRDTTKHVEGFRAHAALLGMVLKDEVEQMLADKMTQAIQQDALAKQYQREASDLLWAMVNYVIGYRVL